MSNNKRGRGAPEVMTKERIEKLENAFSMGVTDEEACLITDISMSSLYNYQKENPDFLDRKRLLKKKTILKARQTVLKDLDNVPTAQWYLERKAKNEFGQKIETPLHPIERLIINFPKMKMDESKVIEAEKVNDLKSLELLPDKTNGNGNGKHTIRIRTNRNKRDNA